MTGVVSRVRSDGTVDVRYPAGGMTQEAKHVKRRRVRPLSPSSPPSSSSCTDAARHASGASASAPLAVPPERARSARSGTCGQGSSGGGNPAVEDAPDQRRRAADAASAGRAGEAASSVDSASGELLEPSLLLPPQPPAVGPGVASQVWRWEELAQLFLDGPLALSRCRSGLLCLGRRSCAGWPDAAVIAVLSRWHTLG